MIKVKVGFFEAVYLAGKKVIDITVMILSSLWMIIMGAISFKDSLAGPVGIYIMTQKAAEIGFMALADFTARLSVSLFVINLLPIPVLDGGHLLFILIEGVIGRQLPDKFKDIAMSIGMTLLLGLMVFMIYQDSLSFGIIERIRGLFVP
jgi:regulator of sigma E protease